MIDPNHPNNLSPSMFPNNVFDIKAKTGGPGGTAKEKRKLQNALMAKMLTATLVLTLATTGVAGYVGFDGNTPPKRSPAPSTIIEVTPSPDITPDVTPTPTPSVTPEPYRPPATHGGGTDEETPASQYTKPAPEAAIISAFTPPTYGANGEQLGGMTLDFPFTLNDGTPVSVTITGTGGASLTPDQSVSYNATYPVGDSNLILADGKATAKLLVNDITLDYNLTATLHYTMPDDASDQTVDNPFYVSPSFLWESSEASSVQMISSTDTVTTFQVNCKSFYQGSLPFVLDSVITEAYLTDEGTEFTVSNVSTPVISGDRITYTFTLATADIAPYPLIDLRSELYGHCTYGQDSWRYDSAGYVNDTLDKRPTYNINQVDLLSENRGYTVSFSVDGSAYSSSVTGVPVGDVVRCLLSSTATADSSYIVTPDVQMGGIPNTDVSAVTVYSGETYPSFEFFFEMPNCNVDDAGTDAAGILQVGVGVARMDPEPMPTSLVTTGGPQLNVSFDKYGPVLGEPVTATASYTSDSTYPLQTTFTILQNGSPLGSDSQTVPAGETTDYSVTFNMPDTVSADEISATFTTATVYPIGTPSITGATGTTAIVSSPTSGVVGKEIDSVVVRYTNNTGRALDVSAALNAGGMIAIQSYQLQNGETHDFTLKIMQMPDTVLDSTNFTITFTEKTFYTIEAVEGYTISHTSATPGTTITVSKQSSTNTSDTQQTVTLTVTADGTTYTGTAVAEVGATGTASITFSMPSKDLTGTNCITASFTDIPTP